MRRKAGALSLRLSRVSQKNRDKLLPCGQTHFQPTARAKKSSVRIFSGGLSPGNNLTEVGNGLEHGGYALEES